MGLKARVDVGKWPRDIATPDVMRAVGELCKAQVIQRTFREGIGVDDRPMRRYSTTPMSVYFPSETARRLKPKGGAPIYRKRAYRQRGGSKSTYMMTWKYYPLGTLIGRRYEGGYAQYKRESRKGFTSGSVEVDLTLSGQLSRSIRVTKVRKNYAVVQVSGGALAYAAHTNRQRPWFGLSPSDTTLVQQAVADILRAFLEQQTGGAVQ
jgi:hypothetical protein